MAMPPQHAAPAGIRKDWPRGVGVTDWPRRRDDRSSVPFDLRLAVVTATAAFALVLSSVGYRPGPPPFAAVVGDQLSTVALPSLARAIAGLVLLVFLPGYAYVAAVFPNRPGGTSPLASSQVTSARSLTLAERVALSFGLSVGLLSIFGLAIAVSPWEYSRLVGGGFLLLSVIGGSVVATARGHVSPVRAPGEEFDRVKRQVLAADSSTFERAVSIALVVSILLALGTLSLALVVPHTGEAYTGVTLLSPTGAGEAIAGDYPTTLVQHQPTPFVVAIQNREGAQMSYTLVVTEQRVASRSGPVSVAEERELIRQTVAVPAGADERTRIRVAPTMRGSSFRLAFYLYRGTAPAEVNPDTAYRQLYLWVDVTGPDSGS